MVGGGYLAFMENPTSIWEVGLLFAEKYDTVHMVLPINGKRAAPLASAGGYTSFCCPLTQRKGDTAMVTYSELFQFCILLVSVISLVIKVCNKKK